MRLTHTVTLHTMESDNPADFTVEEWKAHEEAAMRSHGIEPVDWIDHGKYEAEVTSEWPGTHEFTGPNGWVWVIGIER